MRKKGSESTQEKRIAAIVACPVGKQIELWSRDEFRMLPDGDYDVIASTMTIKIVGTQVKYFDDYPMSLRRTR